MSNGRWNKPPVLVAARHILMQALRRSGPSGTLGSLAEFVNGTSYDPADVGLEGLPIIRISNISDPSSTFLRTSERFESRFIAATGDLLVSWSASFKSVIWPGPEGVVNQHIFKVTPLGANSRSFIRHAIEAAFDDMQEKSVGIGMMHLRRGDFLGHQVATPDPRTQAGVAAYLDWVEGSCCGTEPPLPSSLAEQRRIVDRLSVLAAKIEEAEGLHTDAATATGLLFGGCIESIVGRWRAEGVRETPLGAWLTDVQYGTSEKTTDDNSGLPILRMGNIQNGRLELTNLKYLQVAEPNRTALLLRRGDILVNRTNSAELVGKCAVFDAEGDYGFASYIIRIRPDLSRANPKVVAAIINSPAGRGYLFRERKQMTGQANVNSKTLREMPIVLPSLEAQEAAFERIEAMRVCIEDASQRHRTARQALDALVPSLLNRAFAGAI